MGAFGGPNIVEDGLTIAADPANVKSYPGTGTALYDLANSGADFTLSNSPSFSTANEGVFSLDGTDDQINYDSGNAFTLLNGLYADNNGTWSVSAWFKFPTSPSGTRTGNQSWGIVGKAGGIATGGTFGIFVGSATDTTYGSYAPYKCACVVRGGITIISSNSVNDDTWHNVCVTWNGSSGDVYFDGVDTGDVTVGASTINQAVPLKLGGMGASTNTSHVFEGDLSSCLLYDKALTSSEVFQNFNATRERYGL